ncbi:MAG: hypothetical protein NTX55_01505, partial [Candidatus Parcubacteria bacterium]|nr:hypothetical protein [Candidatus Parcubacteria bacterium]
SSLAELRGLVGNFNALPKPVMVRVEPHHHLRAINGNGNRKFTMVGRGVFQSSPRRQIGVAVISFMNTEKKKKIAVIPDYTVHLGP